MYVYMADNLALDNQLVYPLLGKTTSLSPSFPRLPTVLCARLKPHDFFSVFFGMSTGTILSQLMLLKSCWIYLHTF